MHIKEIKPSQRKKGRFLVKLEDGDILRVTEEELLRFGLRRGLELDGETWEALRASARTSSAKAQAASIIGSRALSRRELEKRLVRKGNDEADAQAAADWLEDIGAVDDAAYAAAVVRDYGRRGYGPAKVREELRRRGVPREPELVAIHAGLECGLLAEKLPGVDAVSIGPNMRDIHTPHERLEIASVKRTWDWLLRVLAERETGTTAVS